MKAKSKGLEASKLECLGILLPTDTEPVVFWKIFIDRTCVIYSARTYAKRSGARRAAFRFAEKAGISMKSVEVVE